MTHQSLKVNGHHIYTMEFVAPFIYRYRIGVSRWVYTWSKKKAKERCAEAEDRIVATCRQLKDRGMK